MFYIAPNGNDANTGTIDQPLESIYKAQELVSPGDTVYIRGGLYNMRPEQISNYYRIWAYVTKLDKSGTSTAPINYWAYPGETPVFDYTNIKPADKRIIAFYMTGSYIHIKGIEVTGVQVTILNHTQSECFEIKGSNNTLENISMHDGMAIGVYLSKGSNNLILNCDAYRNWDSVSEGGRGGNTDGFGCHAPKGHTNNVFRGCRAWFNSDDGYDLINSHEPVLLDHCWAFYNGYSAGFISRGDGNGFKAGGYGSTAVTRIPYPVPRNTIQFCLAVKNKQSGFYSNHHLNGNNWYNNTAYANKRNYNMLNRESVTRDGYLKDVPGWGHSMKNNLGFGASSSELSNIDKDACDLSSNYFDLDVTVNKNDFISIDKALLTAPRTADGSLPEIDFLKLIPSSDVVDMGEAIGFSFLGTAPDLGCFELNDNLSVEKEQNNVKTVLHNYPNPFLNETQIVFRLNEASNVFLSLYNTQGKQIQHITNKTYPKGENRVVFKRNKLPQGNYFLVSQIHGKKNSCKSMVLL